MELTQDATSPTLSSTDSDFSSFFTTGSNVFSTDNSNSISTTDMSSLTPRSNPQANNFSTYIYIACTAAGLIIILAAIILTVLIKHHKENRRHSSKSRKSRGKKAGRKSKRNSSDKDNHVNKKGVVYDRNFVTVKVSDKVSFV